MNELVRDVSLTLIVKIEDLFLDLEFNNTIDIHELKRLNSLLGGQTLYINSGDYRSKRKGEARFKVTSKYKTHFINHLQGLGFVVVEKEAEKEL
ncbi:MAG: hypothetical protein P4L49_16375 [Desulfosporosinus sp.]|nr:hypothetical protein [Desulfosporosinus sp.]